MTQAKSTLHEALGLETPLREIKNLTWAIILMAEGMDDRQGANALNDVACIVHDKVQAMTDQWNKLVDHLREPEANTGKPAGKRVKRRPHEVSSATLLRLVPQLEALSHDA